MLDDPLLDEVARRLADSIPPSSRVLVFGSSARGETQPGSDLDVLVIEPSVADPIEESVRLRRHLRGLGVPIDVVVVTESEANRRSAVRGTMVERALRDGRMLVDV